MTVSVQTPFNSSTGNGVTTVFPYTFKILSSDDIKVSVDGSVRSIGTDYTVSGVGSDSGGNVTFLVAPANGTTVVRYSETLIKRSTDYQANGDFRESTVDADFDRIWLGLRDVSGKGDRAIRVPPGESAVELPAAVARASKFLAFDVSGAPAVVAGVSGAPATPYMATLLDDETAASARATLQLPGPASAKSSHFTVSPADRNTLYLVSTASAAVSATLPSASSAGAGFGASFRKVSADSRMVTIGDGTATVAALADHGDAVALRSDGSTWHVEAEIRPCEFSPSFNGDFEIAQRGTSFPLLATGTHVTDRAIAGPGGGGQITFQQLPFSGADDAIPGRPRYYAQIDWTTAPTSGEGRTGYAAFFAVLELRHEDLYRYRGRRITASAMVRFPIGANNKVYLLASMGLGTSGSHGQSGNTISGTGAGADRNSSAAEILYRSSSVAVGAAWQLVQATFDLDPLSGATIAADNVLTIGIGVDYTDIALNDQLQVSSLHFDFGNLARPMPSRTLAERLPQAHRHLYYANQGVVGVAISSSAIQCAVNFPSIMPGTPAITLLTNAPIFRVANSLVTGSSSTITSASATSRGALVTIDGFSGLTAGHGAVYANTANLFRVEYN